MAIPLIARDRIIGFLRMSHTQPNFFTMQHARFAEAVAKHAAIAIENAQLLQAEHIRLEDVERRRQVAESLRGILAILNSNTPSDQILGYILEQACRVLRTDTAVIYRMNVESNILLPRAARNIPEDILPQMKIPIGEGIVGQAIAQRRPVIITDFDNVLILPGATDNRDYLVNWAKQNFQAMLGIPILIKDQVYGGISLYFRDLCCPLAEEDSALAMSFANQAALAIENARLYTQASEIASLEERQRLARELHDSVSQALYGIQLGAQTAREILNDDSPELDLKTALVEPLDYVSSLAEAGLAEMRALIFELRPEALKSEGLVGALTKQANAVRVRHHLQVEARFMGEPELSFEAKEALYRIAQEAMHNSVKHAHATKITLQLRCDDAHAVLCVSDNGAGFDPSGTFPGHLGLRSMRERAMRLDGTLDIASAPKQGTKICVRIPQSVEPLKQDQ
ncbi:MAG: GAF domain-containing protein [Chloroflexi bacterium]|nr:GAF domain-containing protein [Chloroflexota bacterium]